MDPLEFEDYMYSLIIGFLFTIIIYCVPMVVFRYVIEKKPLDTDKAKRLAIIWCIIGYIIWSLIYFLSATGQTAKPIVAIVWGYINYKILISKGNSKESPKINESIINENVEELNEKPIDYEKRYEILKVLSVISFTSAIFITIGFIYVLYLNNNLELEISTSQRDTSINQQDYEALEKKYERLKTRYDNLDEDFNDLKSKCYDANKKATFLDDYVVIVDKNETYYHKYGCKDLDMSEFWVYNQEAAADYYKPCPKCVPKAPFLEN